jgi:hypothetical protein
MCTCGSKPFQVCLKDNPDVQMKFMYLQHPLIEHVVLSFRLCPIACRDNPDVQMKFMYSETLAHQIYAAADMLLVPSLFEPCGLTQVGGWGAECGLLGVGGWVPCLFEPCGLTQVGGWL